MIFPKSIDQDISSPLSKDKGEFNSQSIDRVFSFLLPLPFLSIEENQSFTYLQGGKLFLLLLRFEVMDGSLPLRSSAFTTKLEFGMAKEERRDERDSGDRLKRRSRAVFNKALSPLCLGPVEEERGVGRVVRVDNSRDLPRGK